MAAEKSNVTKIGATVPAKRRPRSLDLAAKGIQTDKDFAKFMSSLMSDIIEGTVTPGVGNAACNAGGKLLKIVELKYKYGTPHGDDQKGIVLTDGEEKGESQP